MVREHLSPFKYLRVSRPFCVREKSSLQKSANGFCFSSKDGKIIVRNAMQIWKEGSLLRLPFPVCVFKYCKGG